MDAASIIIWNWTTKNRWKMKLNYENEKEEEEKKLEKNSSYRIGLNAGRFIVGNLVLSTL